MFDVAIAGLGAWGQRLVAAVQGRSESIRFVAAVNRTPARVAAFATAHGMRLGGELSAVLDDDTVEGVVVAGPAHLHAEVAQQVLDAGKHAMVIKPLALRREDAERMRRTAEAKGLVLAMGHDRCFLPAVDALRRRVASGDLGQIVHAEGDFCVDRFFALTADDWKTDDSRAPPGSLADHMLYTMIELLGPVRSLSVQALRQAATVNISDTATVMMRFASGATGSLTAVGITPTFHRLHVFGTRGWVEIRQNSRFEYCPIEGEPTVIEFPAADLLRRQLEAFAAAARGEAPYPVTPDQAVAGVAVLEAMVRAARSGRAETV